MNGTVENLVSAAISLPPDQRLTLAHRILISVEPVATQDIDAAWDNDGKVVKKFGAKKEEDHFTNFIKAVRSREREDQNADILEGHLSSALCHLGNISHRVGQTAAPDELQVALKNDRASQETLVRLGEHLARNGVDLRQTQFTLGPTLKIDPKTERFVDNAKANELIKRPYRAGFVVPEKV